MLAAANGWDIVGAIGAIVGGVGAAVGGIAAWRAAGAARATSRDALEALAVGMEPSMHVDVFQESRVQGAPLPVPLRMALNVRNSARWAASAVSVEVKYADGELLQRDAELIDTMDADGDLNLALRDVTPEWPPQDWERIDALVRFSDLRGIARYELACTFHVRGGHLVNDGVQVRSGEPIHRRLR